MRKYALCCTANNLTARTIQAICKILAPMAWLKFIFENSFKIYKALFCSKMRNLPMPITYFVLR